MLNPNGAESQSLLSGITAPGGPLSARNEWSSAWVADFLLSGQGSGKIRAPQGEGQAPGLWGDRGFLLATLAPKDSSKFTVNFLLLVTLRGMMEM